MEKDKRPTGRPRNPSSHVESLLDGGRHPVELILALYEQVMSADLEIAKPMGDGQVAATQLYTVMENMKKACEQVMERLEKGTYVAYLEDGRYKDKNTIPIQAKKKG